MTFSQMRTLSLAHTDQAGCVYFGHIPFLAHSVYEQWIVEELGISWNEWFSNPEWIVPIRHMQVDYLTPLQGGNQISIILMLSDIRIHSFETTYLFSYQEKEVCRTKITHIFCDRNTGDKIPIPPILYPLLTQALSKKRLLPSSDETVSNRSCSAER